MPSDIIFSILKIWKYTALPVYRLKNDSLNSKIFVYRQSKIYFRGIIMFLLLFGFSVKSVYLDDNNILHVDVTLFELLTVFSENIFIIVFSHYKRKEISCIISRFITLDKCINKVTKKDSYYKFVKIRILKIIITGYCLTIFCCIFDCINNPDEKWNTIIYFFNWSYHFNFEFLLILFLIILKKQYGDLLQYAAKKKKIDYKDITETRKLYYELRLLFFQIKKNFQFYILIKLYTDLFTTTTGIYYHIRMIFKTETMVSTLFYAFMWTVLISISNFTITYFFDDVIHQVNYYYY